MSEKRAAGGEHEEAKDAKAMRTDGENTVAVHETSRADSLVPSMEAYREMYARSVADPDAFWAAQARELLSFSRPWTAVRHGGFEAGDVAWFLGARLNACYNCVDRHVEAGRGDRVAIIHEGDEPGAVTRYTYAEVLKEVCRLANALRRLGVRRGDTVAIYMPMTPEGAFAMLACARLGAPHSVVFGGFSSEALRDRIIDARSRFVITADEGVRGGRTIPLKRTVDRALDHEDVSVEHVLVLRRTGNEVPWHDGGRDVWMHEAMARERPYCPPEPMDSEDPLFYMYTSGSTGAPKGLQHTTAGYLLYAAITTKYVFDIREGDVYACVADIGWITGHSYIVYGPMALGATTLMFESTPLYPNASRYFDLVQRHRVTQFYTAPTAIRAVMKCGDSVADGYDLSSLRVLGTVGEPIQPEAWRFYHRVFGRGQASVVDSFWQSETGGHMLVGLPGATPMRPGSASFPFFGVEVALVDGEGKELTGNGVSGVLVARRPWPGLARTILGNHTRYLNTYMAPYPGSYLFGDGATRDEDGYYFITGRIDDVINVSGHRIGSAEVETALVSHEAVAEAAVIGVPHDLKGQSLFAYAILRNGYSDSSDLVGELKLAVKQQIGSFAKPDHVLVVQGLPKTRSGKIMRRLLRKIATLETAPEQLGDTSTLADPSVVERLIAAAEALLKK